MSRPNILSRSLETCHFLIWAATKRPDFDHFAVGIRPLIRVSFTVSYWSSEFWVIRIALYKPSFYYWIPWRATEAYFKEFGVNVNDLSEEWSDIPF